MIRVALLCLAICAASMPASAADDYKITQLEQSVRDLRRQVEEQARQINELRSRVLRPTDPASSPSATPVPMSMAWTDAAKWQALKPGMRELDIITLLGPPTSLRNADNERRLLYAMEIGSAGFLSGSVTLRDGVLVLVQQPAIQ